jgi:PAS domain S-box-containing protein
MKHILIVEDEQAHAELLSRALERADEKLQVTVLDRLDEAHAFIAGTLPDLALVDFNLPDGQGNSFVEAAAGRFPVILLTAFGNERSAVEAIKAGALDYVVKSPEMFADAAHLVERSLREWHNLQERQRADARLEAINQLFVTMGADFADNVNRLLTLLGREIGAQMVFYNQGSGGRKMNTVAGWRTAEQLPSCVKCQCAACAETLQYAAGHPGHFAQCAATPETEHLFLHPAEKHSVAGQVIRLRTGPVGILCVYFSRRAVLSEAERRLLGIFSSALAAEENRKRAEDELRAADNRFRQIVQTAIEGIWVSDEHDCLTFVNHRVSEMLGYRSEEMLHRPMRDFIASSELADYETQLARRRQGEAGQFERKLRHRDGREVLTFISACPLFDDQFVFRGGFAMLTDITERRALEMQLRQSQKLDSIGQLAGGVAHDFNNILAAIMMHLSLLQQHPNLDEETVGQIKELENETKRAANLTRQLLMFSRRSVMQVRVVDINDVVQNLLKLLRRLVGEHIIIQFEHNAQLPPVEADSGMLEQVVLNLVVNARDAMPKGGGTITITTRLTEIDLDSVRHHSERRPGKFVTVAVADTGTGMDDATLKRIFEPFFTTKDVGKGTGLGLPTVHGIVKQHQGWIEVYTQLGKGSLFEVYLPAKNVPRGHAETPHAAATHAPRGDATILLVEDEDIVRRPISLYLRKLGYTIIEAANGKEAFKLWRDSRDKIDLLYTDVIMPEGISGLELAGQLKMEKPKLKVIISSGYSTEISAHGVTDNDEFVYLAKPSASAVIASTIRACLDKK